MNITLGERRELLRRRDHVTQTAVARLIGVSSSTIRKWEADPSPAAPLALQLHERCWLLRRRKGMKLRELSKLSQLGVSWIHRAEMGDLKPSQIGALIKFWSFLEADAS